MLPSNPKDLAIVRMVQAVTFTELIPTVIRFTSQVMNFVEASPEQQSQTKHKINTVLTFFEQQFDQRHYIGSNELTLADITAGTVVPGLPDMGISLAEYPRLQAWTTRLMERLSWRSTQPDPETIQAFIPQMKDLVTAALV
jgi:glutathione S-transferase